MRQARLLLDLCWVALVFLAALFLSAALSFSASGQSVVATYDPATSGPLHEWINANGKPGSLLTLPPGKVALEGPAFVNSITLRGGGGDPDRRTLIGFGPRGVLWTSQKAWADSWADRYGMGPDGSRRLLTRPEGAIPAEWDLTDTAMGRSPWEARWIEITLQADFPSGDLSFGGYFSVGPVSLNYLPDPDYGPSFRVGIYHGSSPADPRAKRQTLRLFRKKGSPPIPSAKIVVRVDLETGLVSVNVNGETVSGSIPPGRWFPAILNLRSALGSDATEANGIHGRWMGIAGHATDLRIARFEVATAKGTLALSIDGRAPRVRTPTGNGPVFPVPFDPGIFSFVGESGGAISTRIAGLDLDLRGRPDSSGIRIGQAMGRHEIERVSIEGAAFGIRKLPGLVSYTHWLRDVSIKYADVPIVGYGMTIRAEDLRLAYPESAGIVLSDSNLALSDWIVAGTGRPVWWAFRFDCGSNGGTVSIGPGMWNEEGSDVARSAWLYFAGGSKATSSCRLDLSGVASNVPRGAPTFWLDSLDPAGNAAEARIFGTFWGAAKVRAEPIWTIGGPGLAREVAP